MAELAGIGQYKTVDPKFVRSAKAEADAIKSGISKEYIESRGGVNASGYYGDSWSAEKNLTPEEYDAAVQSAIKAGTSTGAAVNAATNKKQGISVSNGSGIVTGQTSGSSTADAAAKLKAEQEAKAAAEKKLREGQSAYDLLFSEFDRYGMGALVEPLKQFITEGLSRDELTLRLRQTDTYQKRFAANAQRIKSGLRALSEAEYVGLEDQYQNVMRNYGLPASYYTKGDMGVQQGFEKFISGDVSAAELEDRIQTAQNRVINAAPEVSKALREFYPDITNGDILAYALDPSQALTNIKRKVTAAEIQGAAAGQGFNKITPETTQEQIRALEQRANYLAGYGVTGEAARQGYQTIGSFLPRASQLGDIYAKQGEGPFTQTTAEQEVFGTAGATEAQRKRRRLAELETAQFSGTTGAAQGALGRERAGQF